jgi:hypothetical protein
VRVTQVGKARIDFDADGTAATVSYDVHGIAVTKRVARQPYGSAPADNPDDHSDLWWNPTNRAGASRSRSTATPCSASGTPTPRTAGPSGW